MPQCHAIDTHRNTFHGTRKFSVHKYTTTHLKHAAKLLHKTNVSDSEYSQVGMERVNNFQV